MRQAKIYFKNEDAGILQQQDDGFFKFIYNQLWKADNKKPSISLTLPKLNPNLESKYLFPFFYSLLPEGNNRILVCKKFKLDADDYFGILMKTAKYDCIGAIKVEKI